MAMITYTQLANRYSGAPPKGFREFTNKHGVAKPNTCAVRLSFALFECDQNFFKNVRARSGTEWYGLPTVAADMAIVLNRKIRPASIVKSRNDVSGKKGVIFFDTITGFGGSGHISLWDGARVLDGGDYFTDSPRTYFWQLM